MKFTIENGCFVYDFQGIPGYTNENDPNYGIYKFKKGFNGEVIEFAGEFDRVYSPGGKKTVDFCEKLYNRVKH